MKSPLRSLFFAIGLLSLTLPTPASAAGHELSAALPSVCNSGLPVKLTPSLKMGISITQPEVIGVVPQGVRASPYFTGGTMQEVGGTLSGTIQDAGGDWWNLRLDGVMELDIIGPIFQATDGTLGEFRGKGRGDMGPDGFGNFLQWILPSKIQIRSVLEFRTPLGSTIEHFNATPLLAVGYVEPTALAITFDISAFGEQTDASFCQTALPMAVQYVSSFKLKALDTTSFSKSDGDQLIQYTYAPGIAVGPELKGVVVPGATLRARVHPDGVADMSLQATLRAASGEAILVNSGGRANFVPQRGSRVPLRIQPDVLAEGTKLDVLNRNSMLFVGEVDTTSGELVLHLYRMPVDI